MNEKNIEDVKDTALKLDKIRSYCPEQFYYIKGCINSLLDRKESGHQNVVFGEKGKEG